MKPKRVRTFTDPLCTKIKYPTERSATKALRQQKKFRTSVKRTYLCVDCSQYHLTSSSKEKQPWV